MPEAEGKENRRREEGGRAGLVLGIKGHRKLARIKAEGVFAAWQSLPPHPHLALPPYSLPPHPHLALSPLHTCATRSRSWRKDCQW